MTNGVSTPREFVSFEVNTPDQVEHVKEQLTDTERRQAQIKDVLVEPQATLAPIQCLPPELLSKIFECCLEAGNLRRMFSMSARNKEMPLLLGRVCRSWRATVYTTPQLWQDIFVNVCDGRYSNGLRKDALPALQTWLAHSGSLPLNLSLLCRTERVLPGLVDIFETIAVHATRWRTVHVRLQNSPVIRGLVCCAFVACASLVTFDVTDRGQCTSLFGYEQADELEGAQPVQFDLSRAPLHQLSLSLAGLTIRDVRAHWSMLTRLSFMQDARSSASSLADYASVLRQCTSLKECSIAIDSGVRDASLRSVTLPHLERLHVHALREAAHTTQVGDFLSALDAPRLGALTIEDSCPRREVVPYYRSLKAFLQARARSLRQFRFTTSSKCFTSEDMVGLVAETPSLTELEFRPEEDSSPGALLAALTPRLVRGDGVECLLPRLERLVVYWDRRETVSMVGDMVEKRYALADRGIAQLKYLSCKPAKISILFNGYMPPYLIVEDLAARLEPISRSRLLQVDWEAWKHGIDFLCL